MVVLTAGRFALVHISSSIDRVTLILSQVKIAPLGEVSNFAVGDGALEHPESAVGVDELDAAFAEGDLGFFDRLGDLIGSLDVVDFDVDHTQTDSDFWANLLEGFKVCLLYTSPSPRDPIGSRMPSSA